MHEHAFFYRTLMLFSIALIAFCAIAMPLVHLRLHFSDALLQYVMGLGVLLAIAALYTKRGPAPRLVNTAMMAFWSALFTNLHMIPMFIAARSRLPYRDAMFARWDEALGLGVPRILGWFQHHAQLRNTFNATYDLLLPMMALAIIIPPMVNRMDVAKRYSIACIVAALLSFPIAALWPAEGAWVYYGYHAIPSQAQYTQAIHLLRTDAWTVVDLNYRAGLICFPSFHAILALLTAVALWPIKYARYPAAIIAGAITVSTITTGNHYTVDVLSGVVITALSVYAAKRFEKFEARMIARKVPAEASVIATADRAMSAEKPDHIEPLHTG